MLFLNEAATTEIYPNCHTLSLHDSLPISARIEFLDRAPKLREVGADAVVLVHRAYGPIEEAVRLPGRLADLALAHRADRVDAISAMRSEEHTSELQSLMRISYAVSCLKKKTSDKHKTSKQIIM